MKWEKRGLVYSPTGDLGWSRHSALQPTPILDEGSGSLRIYFGTRDDHGVSRVGFADLDPTDPCRVLRTAKQPALDVGQPGTFDDNGVVPCAVVRRDGRIWLYYAGYQIPSKVKFHVFGGLAVSDDGGETFQRVHQVPVLDRTDDELHFRVAHTVLWEDGRCRVWYGGGSTWRFADDKELPVYDVRYVESEDGVTFPSKGTIHVTFESSNEFRIGRPFVHRHGSAYKMFYGVATIESGYRLGYAESDNGFEWERRDEEMTLTTSDNGWDSEMVAYPSVCDTAAGTFMFYNGNQMGREGFGVAELIRW